MVDAAADVRSEGETGWVFTCRLCDFESTGWRTKALAGARKQQHMAEHEGADPEPIPIDPKQQHEQE